jgi:hypothetical protein
VPALSYTIHKHNPSADVKINFKGMAIGDGLCDPVTMLDYGDFLYDVGLLDEVQRDLFRKKQVEIRSYIAKGLWQKAYMVRDFHLQDYVFYLKTWSLHEILHAEDTTYIEKYTDIYLLEKLMSSRIFLAILYIHFEYQESLA